MTKFTEYSYFNQFLGRAEVQASKRRAYEILKRDPAASIDIRDPELDQVWASMNEWSSATNPYYNYFFMGEDMRVYMSETADDPEFGDMPIAGMGFNIQQQKAPVFGYWSHCVDEETEALTKRGWVTGAELSEDDTILSMNKNGLLRWSSIKGIYREKYKGKMHRITSNGIDALVTPGHKFALESGALKPIDEIRKKDRVRYMGEAVEDTEEFYTDVFVEFVGWSVTEGHYRSDACAVEITQSHRVNPQNCYQIEYVLKSMGVDYRRDEKEDKGVYKYYVGAKNSEINQELRRVAPDRVMTIEFINSLSKRQREILLKTLIAADGWNVRENSIGYGQLSRDHIDSVVYLSTLLGIPTTVKPRSTGEGWEIVFKVRKVQEGYGLDFNGGYRDGRTNYSHADKKVHEPTVEYNDYVWCPETEYGTFVCRRGDKVYVTGNTYDAVMRGSRLIEGQLALFTKGPNYMKRALSRSAHRRGPQHLDIQDRYPVPESWREEEVNYEEYWGQTLDPAARLTEGNIFSIHPPFDLVCVFGKQNTSMEEELFDASDGFRNDTPLYVDTNQRLVEGHNEFSSRMVLAGCEITDMSTTIQPNAFVMEQYSFFARDLIVPRPSESDPINTQTSRSPSGGGVN